MSVVPQGGVFDIEIFQGGTFTRLFILRESDQYTRVPLTGWQGQAQFRDKPGGAVVEQFTVQVSQESDPEEDFCGVVAISMSPEQTANLTKSGYYDVALVFDNGVDLPEIRYMVEGKAALNKRVTVVT